MPSSQECKCPFSNYINDWRNDEQRGERPFVGFRVRNRAGTAMLSSDFNTTKSADCNEERVHVARRFTVPRTRTPSHVLPLGATRHCSTGSVERRTKSTLRSRFTLTVW